MWPITGVYYYICIGRYWESLFVLQPEEGTWAFLQGMWLYYKPPLFIFVRFIYCQNGKLANSSVYHGDGFHCAKALYNKLTIILYPNLWWVLLYYCCAGKVSIDQLLDWIKIRPGCREQCRWWLREFSSFFATDLYLCRWMVCVYRRMAIEMTSLLISPWVTWTVGDRRVSPPFFSSLYSWVSVSVLPYMQVDIVF